jgi:hypothetical protein
MIFYENARRHQASARDGGNGQTRLFGTIVPFAPNHRTFEALSPLRSTASFDGQMAVPL